MGQYNSYSRELYLISQGQPKLFHSPFQRPKFRSSTNLCSSKMPIGIFWGSKIVKCSSRWLEKGDHLKDILCFYSKLSFMMGLFPPRRCICYPTKYFTAQVSIDDINIFSKQQIEGIFGSLIGES